MKPGNTIIADKLRNRLPSSNFEFRILDDLRKARLGQSFSYGVPGASLKVHDMLVREAISSYMETLIVNLNIKPDRKSNGWATGIVFYNPSAQEGWLFYNSIRNQLGDIYSRKQIPGVNNPHPHTFHPNDEFCFNMDEMRAVSIRIDYPMQNDSFDLIDFCKKIGNGLADAVLKLFPVKQATDSVLESGKSQLS